ncbi:hypothetical protein SDRG_06610 [Saprolegnia diclina VS20]|uniref:Secreted protein n=1 Tax=Saprolegnia diclina (strain VS20) TaxID=1156394 RepID=T0QPU3_SAPDV|nr:hypothetical protein SDRG_06610 [Saprolegnia diclina VS20]EQC35860.1 hypothetical protein SDRG_06610 [Saprolegnia diclina VS20]|eukprot:XP_008610622.1 hypothetical protein SDRG_06610 [Saprolegnia diclina VS20]
MHLRYLLLLSGATFGLACSSLGDASSPMNHTLSQLPFMNATSLGLSTSYATCIGSTDIKALSSGLLGAATAEPACLRAISDLMPLFSDWSSAPSHPKPSRFTNNTLSHDSFSDKNESSRRDDTIHHHPMVDALNFTNAKAQTLCAMLVNVVPCLEKAIMPFVLQTINAGGCCTAALNDVAAQFGASADVVVATLVRDLTNVFCSTQSPGFFSQGNQTCAYSFAQSALHAAAPLHRLFKAGVQLPTNEACSALVANDVFQLTQSRAMTPLFTAPYVPSTCVQPIDALLSGVARWPWIQTSSMWSKVLGAGSCLPNPANASECFHLPSGFASTCTYTTKLEFFTEALGPMTTMAPMTPAPTNATKTAVQQGSSSGGKTVSSVALIILSILYYYV